MSGAGGREWFTGFLPPFVDGGLLEIVNMTYADYPPRRNRTREALQEEMFIALEVIQSFFREHLAPKAARIVDAAFRERSPYCLYLRSFALSARTAAARPDPYGLAQVGTLSPSHDQQLQGILDKHIGSHAPLVAVANPVWGQGPIAQFVLADDTWAPFVQALVRNASAIVVLFLQFSPGVTHELELLRAAQKTERTLIVSLASDPLDHPFARELLAIHGTQLETPAPLSGSLEDFPLQVVWDGKDDVDGALGRGLDAILGLPPTAPIDATLEIPPPFGPPEPIRARCDEIAQRMFDEGTAATEERRFEDAENAFFRAIAFSYWARQPVGCAMSYAMLGKIEDKGFGEPKSARDAYRGAIELFEQVGLRSEVARSFYPKVIEAAAELEERHGNINRAASLRARRLA